MLTIRVDGYEIDLSALEDVLVLTGIGKDVIDQFSQDLLLSDSGQANPIWADAQFKADVIKSVGQSVPRKLTTAELPALPDQLSLLLRSEITLVSGKYVLSSEERDEAEQLLQNIIRPIIYHIIDRNYANKPNAQPAALVADAISQTITTSWQAVNTGNWEIRPLDSLVGHIGYEFRTDNEVMYSNSPLIAKGRFFYDLAIALAEKICAIHLE